MTITSHARDGTVRERVGVSEGQWIWLSRWRLLGGLVLGHLAAAYAFSASMLLFAAVTDTTASLPRTLDGWWSFAHSLAFAPLAAGAVGLWVVVLMLPASLLTSPLTYFAARQLRAGAWPTMAMGATVGLVDVCLLLAWDGGLTPSNRPRPPGMPPFDLMFYVCGTVAGIAYSAVVWRLCIRPRLDRYGGAHWREV